jgi:hypothetical protein
VGFFDLGSCKLEAIKARAFYGGCNGHRSAPKAELPEVEEKGADGLNLAKNGVFKFPKNLKVLKPNAFAWMDTWDAHVSKELIEREDAMKVLLTFMRNPWGSESMWKAGIGMNIPLSWARMGERSTTRWPAASS